MRTAGMLLIGLAIAWLTLVTVVMGWWLSGGCIIGSCGPDYAWAWGPAVGSVALMVLAFAALSGNRPATTILEIAGWALAGASLAALAVAVHIDPPVLGAIGVAGFGIGFGSAIRRLSVATRAG